MPNIHELIDNIALQLSNKESMEVWFSSLDLKNAYSQLQLSTDTSKQCNFSIVGGETNGTYRFLTGFYGLGDMPKKFQRVMDSLLKDCYIDDILIASKGSLNEHKAILTNILNILDNKNLAVKWEKCAFFQKEIEWLFFKISNSGVKLLVGKSDSIKNQPNPTNIPELRSFFGSINQYMKFVSNLSSLSSPLRPLLVKKSVCQWNDEHTKAFEELKQQIVNIIENNHFDIKMMSRLKTDA